MKHFFTLFLGIVFLSGLAQTYPSMNNFSGQLPGYEEIHDFNMAKNNISSMTKTYQRFNKKGKPKGIGYVSTFKYDGAGFLVEHKSNKNSKNRKFTYAFKDSLLVNYSYYEKDELKMNFEIQRNSLKKITDVVKKDGKNSVINKQHYDYDTVLNRVSKTTVYGKNNNELKALEYTYYDGKTMKQAKEYKKGKLKKVWNYTCDPAGIKEEKVKQTQICKNVNVDENGNRVESNRIVNPKGGVELRINTFDKDNRMIHQKIYDDIKHVLKSEYSYTVKAETEELESRFYSRKGKEFYYNKVVYSKSHKILSSEVVRGGKQKHLEKTTFIYNDKDLLTHSETFDSKNRKTSESTSKFN